MAIVAVAAFATGCSRERTVKIGWDPPAVAPDRYRIFVDDRLAQEIKPPPLSAACQCLTASVTVSRGPHRIEVVAYSLRGGASPAAVITIR